jgi:hypothetical protein
LGINVQNYFLLLDDYARLVGNDSDIKNRCFELRNHLDLMAQYGLDFTNDYKLDYELSEKKLFPEKLEEQENEDITAYVIKVYGYINKKQISVKDYTKLYLALRDGKINIQ